MHSRLLTCLAIVASCLLVVCVKPARSEDPKKVASEKTRTSQQARAAVERGLAFIEKDAAKWRKEHECATCHHGTMTVWAFSEAKRQGYAVGAETLAENLQWTEDQFMPSIRIPRDPRPGWNLVRVPAIYLGVMSRSLPILSRDA